jgi:hypothetical protein
MSKNNGVEYERSAFCGACGEFLDDVKTPTMEANGQVEAMLLQPLRQEHQKVSGCKGTGPNCEGWTFGPWRAALGYDWPGERMFKWSSKEARIYRAFSHLNSEHQWLDKHFHKLTNLRDLTHVKMDLHEYLERMLRFKRAAHRLRDRLGMSNTAAYDDYHERHPHLPGESESDYWKRMQAEKAK